jgi:hypothetical protein
MKPKRYTCARSRFMLRNAVNSPLRNDPVPTNPEYERTL